jgi:hypothetical protein
MGILTRRIPETTGNVASPVRSRSVFAECGIMPNGPRRPGFAGYLTKAGLPDEGVGSRATATGHRVET